MFQDERDEIQYREYYDALSQSALCADIPAGIAKIIAHLSTGTIMTCNHCHKEESILVLYSNQCKEFYVHRSLERPSAAPLYFCKACLAELKCMRCFNVLSTGKRCKFHCFRSEGPHFESKAHMDMRNGAFAGLLGFRFPCCRVLCSGTFPEPETQTTGCNVLTEHLLRQY